MQYLTLVIMGLTDILVLGVFFFYIFKRKISIATYVEKVHFYSNLILLLMTLHYLNLITPYLSESLLFHSLAFSPARIIPNLGALLFWTLLIYVVKKILLRKAESKISIPSSVITKKSSSNFKVTALALFPVIATAIYFAYPNIAPKFSSNLLIQYTCDGGSYTNEYVVDVEKKEVVVISKVFDEKNVLFSSAIRKLSDCIVVNSKNWTCGGKYNFGGYDATNKSIDGVYGYIRRTGEETSSCKSEQLN